MADGIRFCTESEVKKALAIMAPPGHRYCHECVHWSEFEPATVDTEVEHSFQWQGRCKRYPPMRCEVDGDGDGEWWQPCTNAWDYCGEFFPIAAAIRKDSP